ncbi:unnamed protein product [Euphydryas editha]|uniref:Uncharacterized protein n=1 Tax=Euphydryas editha TaxID=104508 RepID=A0AAU9V8B2_EUPED|nr:unnamed protein product [Euphydryas editha]
MKTAPQLPLKPDISIEFYICYEGNGYAESYRVLIGVRIYDEKLRSLVKQELAIHYETVLHTNINTHVYSRLARYFKIKLNDPALFGAFFKIELPEEMHRVCSFINADSVQGSH